MKVSQEPDSSATSTAWTFIVSAQGPKATSSVRQSCLEYLAKRYWTAVYAYVRHHGYSEADALDLTQGYFQVFIERRYMDQVRRERGRFRTFLFTSVRNYLHNERDFQQAAKRKPQGKLFRLKFTPETSFTGALPLPSDPESAEASFMREWARSVMAHALKEMEKDCRKGNRADHWEVFRRHVSEADHYGMPSYKNTAAALGWRVEGVRKTLFRAKERFRGIVRGILRESVASNEDVESELQDLKKFFG